MRYASTLMMSALIALVSACSSGSDDKQHSNVAAPAQNAAASAAKPEASANPAAPVAIDRKDELLNFAYKYPAAAAAIPALNIWLKGHADDRYKKAHGPAEQDAKAAKAQGFPYRGHEFQQEWKTVADTPAALVMQADGYEYTGGAHGMPFTSAVIWDRAKGVRLGTGDVIDLARLATVGGKRFCDALNLQRKEKRGVAVKAGSNDPFDTCPDMTKQQILPLSKDGKALDAIRIVIGPYEAGPYAEGSYTIDLPIDAALRAAIKTPYRGWFVGTP